MADVIEAERISTSSACNGLSATLSKTAQHCPVGPTNTRVLSRSTFETGWIAGRRRGVGVEGGCSPLDLVLCMIMFRAGPIDEQLEVGGGRGRRALYLGEDPIPIGRITQFFRRGDGISIQTFFDIKQWRLCRCYAALCMRYGVAYADC